jgi:SAM-dependent methyltransferase
LTDFYSDSGAVAAYIRRRELGGSRNEVVEEKAFVDLVGEVFGLNCLDLGCGYGHYSRIIADRGATVVGIDKAPVMIEAANTLNLTPNTRYLTEDIETITFAPAEFDLIISNLTFHYLADFGMVARNAYRWLRSGGQLVFSVEHPIFTAAVDQLEDRWADPAHTQWIVSNYADAGSRYGEFGLKYHRPISEYVDALIAAGFRIGSMAEPIPGIQALETRADLREDVHRPLYLLMRCEKPFP